MATINLLTINRKSHIVGLLLDFFEAFIQSLLLCTNLRVS